MESTKYLTARQLTSHSHDQQGAAVILGVVSEPLMVWPISTCTAGVTGQFQFTQWHPG